MSGRDHLRGLWIAHDAVPLTAARSVGPALETVVWLSASSLPLLPNANRALDLAIAQLTDANLSSIRVYNAPTLFVKPHGAAVGTNHAPDRHEMLIARDYDAADGYNGGPPVVFNPPGGTPYLFQLTTEGNGLPRRNWLRVFTPAGDVSQTSPSYQVLRSIHSYPVDGADGLSLLSTPSKAWLLIDDPTLHEWHVYHFDRNTAELTLDYDMPTPFAADDLLGDRVVTDDGTIYAMAFLGGKAGPPRVIRVVGGVVTDLWQDGIVDTPSAVRFFGLYSTGARVYAAVADAPPVTFTAGGPKTFDRYRYSFITPDVARVPAPAAPTNTPSFTLPPTCNPITNAPCKTGEACDIAPSRNGFSCAKEGTARLCEACDPDKGTLCVAGTTCRRSKSGLKCVKLCCTGEDCGGGTCINDPTNFPVGYCALYNGTDYDLKCTGFPSGVGPSGGACSEPSVKP